MATNSPIEWTDATWNPVTGCDKISPGCKHCYAERMAKRLKAARNPNYKNGFVNSMSDLFHEDVHLDYIQQVFDVMNRANWHQYQVLTKRAERVHELSKHLKWAPHIWMGVSVESEKYLDRIDHLRKTGAHVKFLSLEPLLGPLPRMNLRGIDWAIVGGESGPGARPMDEEWVLDIRDQCLRANVAFFFKQW